MIQLAPDAQSALLAASELALERADLADTLTPVRSLVALPKDTNAREDPWWQYARGPGRQVDALLSQMWRAIPR